MQTSEEGRNGTGEVVFELKQTDRIPSLALNFVLCAWLRVLCVSSLRKTNDSCVRESTTAALIRPRCFVKSTCNVRRQSRGGR